MSVTVLLEDDLDVSRGDMLCAGDAPAQVARDLRADVCWLDDAPARPSAGYLIKHTTRTTRAELTRIEHRVEVESLRTEVNSRIDALQVKVDDLSARLDALQGQTQSQ